MAFESQTYENILARMKNRLSSVYPDIDVREGSIAFNALAAAAAELAISYLVLNEVLNESFVQTASREFILLACDQMGIDVDIFDATEGAFKGEFDVEVPINSRWNCDLYNYTVVEKIASDNEHHAYKLKCEVAGTAANTTVGSLTAITDSPTNLTYAELTECLIPGEDEYSDDAIRQYYYNFLNSSASDGNIGQYERWCEDYDHIGNYKVIPLWNGANTVKVSILSSTNTKASEALIEEFQRYLDPNVTGMGDGVAPIGAFVTVDTATEIPVNISATVTLKPGYSQIPDIDEAVRNYFTSVAYKKSQISYMAIGVAIMNVEGVDFIANLAVNGGANDVVLGDEEIPVLGTTDWTVAS